MTLAHRGAMTDLTDRQRDVARLVREGWTDKQIAEHLGISPRRVAQLVTCIAARWALDPQRSYRVQIARHTETEHHKSARMA